MILDLERLSDTEPGINWFLIGMTEISTYCYESIIHESGNTRYRNCTRASNHVGPCVSGRLLTKIGSDLPPLYWYTPNKITVIESLDYAAYEII